MERTSRRRCAKAVWQVFKQAEGAVSPVISTILMVAITVVLAATAFVLVAGVGGSATESAPTMSLVHDDVEDQIQVLQGSPKADWDRITLVLLSDEGTDEILLGNGGSVINEPAGVGGVPLPEGDRVDVVQAPTAITPGDFLHFCRNGAGDGRAEIQLVDSVANQLLRTFVFDGLELCS